MELTIYLLRRLVRIVVSLGVVSMITFGLLQLAPGNFADIARLGSGTGLDLTAATELATSQTALFGADVPIWQQYLNYMGGFLQGDLGVSYKYPQFSVQEIIGQAFPVSASIALCAVVLALLIALPLGVLAAVRKDSVWDHAPMFTLTVGHAVPGYVAAVGLVLLFSSTLGLLPTSGWNGPANMVMPVLALAIGPAGVLARYVRSSVLETLREEYVIAAYAKGGRPFAVITRHALRNSLMPLVTIVGPLLAGLMVGTIFIETIFGIPGLGRYFAIAASSRDMPLLMGTAMFFAAVIMLTNLAVDVAYRYIDPRIRLGETRVGATG